MDVERISKLASGTATPEEIDSLSPFEELLYWRLKNIYDGYGKKLYNASDGAKLKQKAVTGCVKEQSRFESWQRHATFAAERNRDIEQASNEYAKNPCMETAEKLFWAVHRCRRKNDAEKQE